MATTYLESHVVDTKTRLAIHQSCDLCFKKLDIYCIDAREGRLKNAKTGTTHEQSRVKECEIYIDSHPAK